MPANLSPHERETERTTKIIALNRKELKQPINVKNVISRIEKKRHENQLNIQITN